MAGNTSPNSPLIEVAAGLVFHQGRLLLTQRRPGDHLEGLWEFPGGKRELGESFERCLERELEEELGIEVKAQELLDSIVHSYPEKTVDLRFFRCSWRSGEPRALGCQKFAWVRREELGQYTFPPADRNLMELLRTRLDLWEPKGEIP